MKLSKPRVAPLAKEGWTEEQRKFLEPFYTSHLYNVTGTLARHWEASKKFGVWNSHILGATGTLPPRDREILILRTGWLCQAEYEWAQHVLIGKANGLTDGEIEQIRKGPNDEHWSSFDAALVRASDELHADAFVSDVTWKTLSERYTTEQLMDVVFTVGQYTLVSMALNTFGVQLDKGLKGF
jgi:4-carboxymuconolactone decarboxylase